MQLTDRQGGLSFFQRNNPILRHTVLRKRATLEEMGLLDKIAVDIWPSEHENLPMFEGLGLQTSAEFDAAYAAAQDFTEALRKRVCVSGFHEDDDAEPHLLEHRQWCFDREEAAGEASTTRGGIGR